MFYKKVSVIVYYSLFSIQIKNLLFAINLYGWRGVFILLNTIVLIFYLLSFYKKMKSKKVGFEENIIQTIIDTKIIDYNFFDGLSDDRMKQNIRNRINDMNNKQDKDFIDLKKMEILMNELTIENLQKLYQWFFYKY